ncbi:MAG: hypothetical protein R3F11_27095 [Verrucomicrobiales bacterium]
MSRCIKLAMDFAQPFRLFFRHPKAWMNLLLLGVCALIPLIGYLVITGYMAQCLAEWERDPEKQEFSEFDFGRFVPYLTAGFGSSSRFWSSRCRSFCSDSPPEWRSS